MSAEDTTKNFPLLLKRVTNNVEKENIKIVLIINPKIQTPEVLSNMPFSLSFMVSKG